MKTSTSVTWLGIYLVASSALMLVLALGVSVFFFIFAEDAAHRAQIAEDLTSFDFLYSTAFRVASFCAGAGLIFRTRWAQRLAIGVVVVSIAQAIFSMATLFRQVEFAGRATNLMLEGAGFVIAIGMLWFLLRPQTSAALVRPSGDRSL